MFGYSKTSGRHRSLGRRGVGHANVAEVAPVCHSGPLRHIRMFGYGKTSGQHRSLDHFHVGLRESNSPRRNGNPHFFGSVMKARGSSSGLIGAALTSSKATSSRQE